MYILFIVYSQKSRKSPHYNRIDQILLFIFEFRQAIRRFHQQKNCPHCVLKVHFIVMKRISALR